MRPLLRGVTLLGGTLGAAGASLSGHQLIAISTLLVTASIVVWELWIAKRRDDLFSKIAMQYEVDPAVLHALTVHEAVRSGFLTSEDTVRLLKAEPDGQQHPIAGRVDRPYRVEESWPRR